MDFATYMNGDDEVQIRFDINDDNQGTHNDDTDDATLFLNANQIMFLAATVASPV